MKTLRFVLVAGLASLTASSPVGAGDTVIGLHAERVPNRISHWLQTGFVDMVPPVHLPTDKTIDETIAVWLRIPKDGRIAVQWLAGQKRYTLKFPPGTVADRIDAGKHQKQAMFTVEGIADVRGARIDADGNTWWHVYEPVPGKSSQWLHGYAWRRTGAAGDNAAADRLLKLYYPGAPAGAAQEMAIFRRLNQCGACHQPDRPIPVRTAERQRATRGMQAKLTATLAQISGADTRGLSFPETDADGFYQPITVLTDSMTLVNIRPWDLNVDDPYVSVWCGKIRARLTTRGDTFRRYTCPDHRVPVGRLDMAAALAHKDAHAFKVCAARRYLYAHMTAVGREAFARGFAECGLH